MSLMNHDDAGASGHQRLENLVRALITMMNAGNMARLDLECNDLRVSLRSHGEGSVVARTGRVVPDVEPIESADQQDDGTGTHFVTAPMIGTFYSSPAPGEPPFVVAGDHIEEGQTIGIIEAMKIMNEIASDRAGTVVELVATNAQPVEFGSPLVRLDPITQ